MSNKCKGGDTATFPIGLHEPKYSVVNVRSGKAIKRLGSTLQGEEVLNHANFPDSPILEIAHGEPVYEIKNPFPFWGTTYILKRRADEFKRNPLSFSFKKVPASEKAQSNDGIFEAMARGQLTLDGRRCSIKDLPRHVLLSLAANSKSPLVLREIARISCEMETDETGHPVGLRYEHGTSGGLRPIIHDKPLFETVANNPHLPDEFKRVMVLNPGAQGENPIVGEYKTRNTHVWEYLRKNSYIPWGHYASNMAHDQVRYNIKDLTLEDMEGLRFLYYQRIYLELYRTLSGEVPKVSYSTDQEALEELRKEVFGLLEAELKGGNIPFFTGNLWGWNYGYGYASSGYRLHASHQQIHNQYALVPHRTTNGVPTYIVGDLVWDHIEKFQGETGREFFPCYISTIRDSASRMDQSQEGPCGLLIFEDENVMAYCPLAQRSQGEVHLMAKRGVGNVLEADISMRKSLDSGILKVMRALDGLGAEMITIFEISKRYHRLDSKQHLFYCFLPRHENSPGSMSEAQGRHITGHYPEDFAWALKEILEGIKMA